jgi:hypothetical protein
MRRLPAVLAALLLLLATGRDAGAVDLYYEAYAAGLNVVDLDAQFDVTPARYQVRVHYRTAGAFRLMVRSEQDTLALGRFEAGRPVPQRFDSRGILNGKLRLTLIDYTDGQPTIRQLEPPNSAERESVPPERQRGTVDSLSAMAALLNLVRSTGRCDGGLTLFDGRRLAALEARTAGTQLLPPTGRSSFRGEALRCDFTGRQIGGFVVDADRADLMRPHMGAAWFAEVGGEIVPVRMTFRTKWFGDATMYLTTR